MFGKKKEKIIDPIIHDEEGNFTLSGGVHILNRCYNVTLCGDRHLQIHVERGGK